ncbi:hypothetical protein UFOVP1413_37 [uncultured Caudovirales phage]|uniref:Uncharacterized protein n=3 Tax=uncultured Caudovirales phage TaxID=2100421 RepID=A0A6J5SB90_9CAUD|nr:hypothetical protein UFOVP1413_37 [uncultured Caudovirales phage]
MSEMAKNARAAMKAKATRMGGKGDPKTKVDASSWSPPEMMNTGAKVGMRPLSRRAFRKGGKVIEKCEGGPAAMRADRKQRKAGGRATSLVTDMINRNVKKANKYREGGDAHVGGYKSGGDVEQDKKLVKKAFRQHDEHMHGGKHEDIKLKKGGRTKKQVGGGMDKKAIPGDAPTRGYGPGKSSTDNYEDMPPPREHIYEDAPRATKYETIDALMKAEGIGQKAKGGGTYFGGTRPTGGRMPKAAGGKSDADDYWTYKAASKTPELAEALEAKAIHPKTTDAEWHKLSPGMRREILRSAQRKGRKDDDDRAEMTRQQTSKTFPNVTKTTSEGDPDWDAMGIKGTGQKAKGGRAGRKAGGRMPKADGGKLVPLSRRQREIAEDVKNSTRPADDSMKTLKRARGGRAKGKTNISITINPQRPQDQQAMLPKMPTPPPMPPPPIAPPGMGPGMPPMPMPPPGGMPPGLGGPPPGMPPMPRKRGGRAYRSYKDMDAGALGGMGRLEKVEIEHGKRVGRLSGGRARSYKDMDAGSLGGMGRIEKIAIQKHKR